MSYAQAGEDLVLDFLTGHAASGFYVDVGANHPVKGSNSYRFYRKGWRGIAVDANPAFAAGFAKRRPRDRFVQACVSDVEQEVDFHIFAQDALSSISGERLYENEGHYRVERVDRLATKTLTSILDEVQCPAEFDFLSVDVEGHDEAVLRALDLARFRPRVILTEVNGTDLDIGRIGDHPIARHVAKAGYQPVAVHWGNIFFRKGA